MSLLKITNRNYYTKESIENLYQYIMNPDKLPNHIIGSNRLFLMDSKSVSKQIIDISNYYYKTGSYLKHFIVSYDEFNNFFTVNEALRGLTYSLFDFHDYPIFYALHENTDHPHFHIAIGTVNICTGKKFPDTKHTYELLCYNLSLFTYKDYKDRTYHNTCTLVYS